MKPLKVKGYGSIPHLPNSRMGPGDHHCHDGQAEIATSRLRDHQDRVIVTLKLEAPSMVKVSDILLDVVTPDVASAGLANPKPDSAWFKCHTCGPVEVLFVAGTDPRPTAIESGWKLDKYSDLPMGRGGAEYHTHSGYCPVHAEGAK